MSRSQGCTCPLAHVRTCRAEALSTQPHAGVLGRGACSPRGWPMVHVAKSGLREASAAWDMHICGRSKPLEIRTAVSVMGKRTKYGHTYVPNTDYFVYLYELRPKIKDALLVRMVVGATETRATRLVTPPTCGKDPPCTAWS